MKRQRDEETPVPVTPPTVVARPVEMRLPDFSDIWNQRPDVEHGPYTGHVNLWTLNMIVNMGWP